MNLPADLLDGVQRRIPVPGFIALKRGLSDPQHG